MPGFKSQPLHKQKIEWKMKMKKGPESIQTLRLLNALRKAGKKNAVWTRVAELLAKPTRQRSEVSLSKLSKNTSSGQTVIVPGKLLASGQLSHALTIACFKASKTASKKTPSGTKIITIAQLMKLNPSGSNTRIIA